MNGTVTLRSAVPSDAEALAELGARSFVAKFGHLYSAENLAAFLACTHTPEVCVREIADPACRIRLAEEAGRLLGMCKLVMACGWPEHARAQPAIELKQLYTAPELIGRGIGSKLMGWAMDEARAFGAREMQASVYSENVEAQRFYARWGFAKVADIEFWVGDHRDAEFLFAGFIPTSQLRTT